MFANACRTAAGFTRPIIVSERCLDGKVKSAIATFILLNDDGWVLTAAHVVQPARQHTEDEPRVTAYDAALKQIDDGPGDFNQKRRALQKLERDDNWIRDVSLWWAQDRLAGAETYAYPSLDVAIVRMDGPRQEVCEYPRFRRHDDIAPGTSVVKIGYPFHEVNSSWNETKDCFELAPGSTPPPLFPIEGMHTRVEDHGVIDGIPHRLVETSTPGLRGQSGGPWLDTNGTVCAMQTMTRHLSLGFAVTFGEGRRALTEHQVLNVGLGVSTETLATVFARHGVCVDWAD